MGPEVPAPQPVQGGLEARGLLDPRLPDRDRPRFKIRPDIFDERDGRGRNEGFDVPDRGGRLIGSMNLDRRKDRSGAGRAGLGGEGAGDGQQGEDEGLPKDGQGRGAVRRRISGRAGQA